MQFDTYKTPKRQPIDMFACLNFDFLSLARPRSLLVAQPGFQYERFSNTQSWFSFGIKSTKKKPERPNQTFEFAFIGINLFYA